MSTEGVAQKPLPKFKLNDTVRLKRDLTNQRYQVVSVLDIDKNTRKYKYKIYNDNNRETINMHEDDLCNGLSCMMGAQMKKLQYMATGKNTNAGGKRKSSKKKRTRKSKRNKKSKTRRRR
jgi:hypothetical protein